MMLEVMKTLCTVYGVFFLTFYDISDIIRVRRDCMKRVKLLLLITIIIFMIACSSNIPQDEYNESLQNNNTILPTANIQAATDNDMKSDIHNNISFISKWGKSMFSNSTAYEIDDNKVGLIISLDKVDGNTIDLFITTVRINLQMVPALIHDNDPKLMYIKAVNVGGSPILEIFIDASDLDDIKTEFMPTNDYIDIVNSSLDSLNKALND